MRDDPSPDPADQLAALRASIDQMTAVAPELVRAARGWFDAFQGQGFSERQALYLTATQMLQSPGVAPP